MMQDTFTYLSYKFCPSFIYIYIYVCVCVCVRSCMYKNELYFIDFMILNGLCGFQLCGDEWTSFYVKRHHYIPLQVKTK